MAVIDIKTKRVIAGRLAPRARKLVREWADTHERELMANWKLAQKDGGLKPIDPLL